MSTGLDMAIDGLGVPEPIKEFRFHRKRKWRFDYAWPDYMIAFEYEGGTWSQGGHVRGVRYSQDCEKYAVANMEGWIVVRATADMIESGLGFTLLLMAFEKRREGSEKGHRKVDEGEK